jgi:hypothetical protein
MEFDKVLQKLYSEKIDFRYNSKSKSYSVVRLNADPSMVLYKDGVARKTTEEEIRRQLAKLLT